MDRIVAIKITSDGKAFVVDQRENAGAVEKLQQKVVALEGELEKLQKKLNDASKNGAPPLKKLGDQAEATSQQLRMVAPQITDVVTQLSAGASPMQVFIQQGGQLKDVFGGVGPAVRAVGGYIAGMISPLTVSAAAVAGLAVAWKLGHDESVELTKQIILSGNSAGITASRYYDMAAGLQATGATKGAALEALQLIAAAGRVAGDQLQRFTTLAIDMERFAGKAIEQTAQEIQALGEVPLQASIRLTQQYNYLTAAQLLQIKALQDTNQWTEAARVAQDAYASAQEAVVPKLRDQLGYLSRAWLEVKDAIKKAGDAALEVGRVPTLQQQLEQAKRDLAAAQGKDPNRPGGAMPWQESEAQVAARVKALERAVTLEEAQAKASADRAESEKNAQRYAAQGDQYLPTRVKLEREIEKAISDGLKAGVAYADVMERVKQIKKQIVDQEAKDAADMRKQSLETQGLIEASQIKENIERINQLYRFGALTQVELIQTVGAVEVKLLQDDERRLVQRLAIARTEQNSEREVFDLQQQIIVKREAIDARRRKIDQDQIARFESLRRAAELFNLAEQQQFRDEADQARVDESKRYEAAQLAVTDYIHALKLESDELQFQVGVMGRSGTELQKLIELHKIDVRMQQQLYELEKRKLPANQQAEEEARIRSAAAEAAANVDTKMWVDQWSYANKEVGESFYDAITRKGQSARDRLVRLFAETQLKPNIIAAFSGISGSIANALVGGNPAAAAGGAGGLLSTAGAAASIFGAGGFGGAFQAGMGWLTAGNTLGGTLSAAGSLVGTGTAAGTASGLSMMAGALAPIALGVAAIYALTKSKGGPKEESSYRYFSQQGDPTGAKTLADSIASTVSQYAARAGAQVALQQLGVQFAIDNKGTAQTQFDVVLPGIYSRGGRLGNTENVGRSQEALQAEASAEAIRVAIAVLAQANLPARFADALGKIDLNQAADVLQAQLEEILQTKQLSELFASFGQAMSGLVDISIEDTKGLVAAAGGWDQLSGQLGGFFQAYFTEGERQAAMLDNLTRTFQRAGIELPKTEEAYKQAVIASLADHTQSGQQTAAVLLANAEAFHQVTTAAGDSTDAIEKAAEIQRKRQDLEVAIAEALGNKTAKVTLERQRELDGLDAALRPLQERLYALQDEAEATGQLTKQMQDLQASLASTLNTARANLQSAWQRERQVLVDRVNAYDTARDALQRAVDAERTALGEEIAAKNAAVEAVKAAYAAEAQALRDRIAAIDSAEQNLRTAYNAEVQVLQQRSAAIDAAVQAVRTAYEQDVQALQQRQAAIDAGREAVRTAYQNEKAFWEQRATDIQNAQEAVRTAMEGEKQLAEQAVARLRQFTDEWKRFRDSLVLGQQSTLSPERKLFEAKAQYDTTLAKAQAGDDAAKGDITAKLQAYLDAARPYYASTQAYTDIFNKGMADLDALGASAAAQQSQAEQALASAQAQLDALGVIGTRTLSVAEAMARVEALQAQGNPAEQLAILRQQASQFVDVDGHVVTVAEAIHNLTDLTAAGDPAEQLQQLQASVAGIAGIQENTLTTAQAIAQLQALEAAGDPAQQLSALNQLVGGVITITPAVMTVQEAIDKLVAARAGEDPQAALDALTAIVNGVVPVTPAVLSVQEAIANLVALGDPQGQLDALNAQVGGILSGNETLVSIDQGIANLVAAAATRATAQQELDAMDQQVQTLLNLDTTILSLADAIAAFNAARAGQQGFTGNQDFVTGAYQSALGRAPDAGGLAYWTSFLENGSMTRDQVANSLTTSPEASIYNAYEQLLHRDPAMEERQYWMNLLRSGQVASTGEIWTKIMLSPEYINGSHASGLAQVPFDGYRAELHKYEAVATAGTVQDINRIDWKAVARRQAAGDDLVGEIRALRAVSERQEQQLRELGRHAAANVAVDAAAARETIQRLDEANESASKTERRLRALATTGRGTRG